MENNIVFKNKEVSKIDSRVLGVSGENKQQILVFTIDEGFIDGTAYLELILPTNDCCDSKKYSIELEKNVENKCYKLEVKRSLLKHEGVVKMQLKVISNGVEVYKTTIFDMNVLEAINAVESIEEDYPCFVEQTKVELQELQEGLEQVCDNLKDTKEEIEQVKKEAEGSIKEETDPTVPAWAKEPNKPTYTASEVGALPADTVLFSGNYEDLENKPEPIDTSKFVTKAVDDLVNYYKKEEVNLILNNFSKASIEVVESLPTENIRTNIIYLLAKENAEESNIYDEYIYVSEKWEKIGDTKVDLSGYVTIERLNQAIANFLMSEQVKMLIQNALADYYTRDEMDVLLGGKASTEYVDNKAGRMKVESMTESTVTILPNVYYKWGEVAELNITLGEGQEDGYTNEFCFEFVSGETATTLIMDENIRWVSEPSIGVNTTYQVSILNGIGVIVGV